MADQIFVNLPVKDLNRAMAFFSALGFGVDPEFTDDKAACLILGENIYAMLLVEPFFQTFTPKPVSDAAERTEVLVCLSVDSRARVDDLVSRAVAAGATAPMPPQDHGFMYAHGFHDPDGHAWELVHMKAAAAAGA
jgi:predicted lactoylglutathione lyase